MMSPTVLRRQRKKEVVRAVESVARLKTMTQSLSHAFELSPIGSVPQFLIIFLNIKKYIFKENTRCHVGTRDN